MSHPVWVRGLKLKIADIQQYISRVAPRVGAWIETIPRLLQDYSLCVAPRVGAWIETDKGGSVKGSGTVAPRVGAWIETLKYLLFVLLFVMSHPVWVRGLKLWS